MYKWVRKSETWSEWKNEWGPAAQHPLFLSLSLSRGTHLWIGRRGKCERPPSQSASISVRSRKASKARSLYSILSIVYFSLLEFPISINIQINRQTRDKIWLEIHFSMIAFSLLHFFTSSLLCSIQSIRLFSFIALSGVSLHIPILCICLECLRYRALLSKSIVTELMHLHTAKSAVIGWEVSSL